MSKMLKNSKIISYYHKRHSKVSLKLYRVVEDTDH